MYAKLDEAILNALQNGLLTEEENEVFSELASTTEMLGNYSPPDYMRIETSSYETVVTGKNLPKWIQPLQFEKNLNAALDAVDACDALMVEIRNYRLAKVQHNFISGMLRSLDDDQSALKEHLRILSDEISNLEYFDNLATRLGNRLIELVEYTKAVKLGGRILFGFDESSMEYSGGFKGVAKIRESLRNILFEYRKIASLDQEVVVPISLKQAKNSAGNYLVKSWSDNPTERSRNVDLTKRELEIDLSLYSDISNLSFQRIRRIGVQVIDKESGMVPKPDEATVSTLHPNFWSITVQDDSDGVRLGSSATADKFKFKPVVLKNVAGSRSSLAISWSKLNSLTNVNANRRWKVKIGDTSNIEKSASDIHDIVLHFHLAYQP
ncbi:MAG: hypothetical protein MI684_04290 [Chlorobiales bacterium]|nr:hypothetical protein [Chlorobiales bacterium]